MSIKSYTCTMIYSFIKKIIYVSTFPVAHKTLISLFYIYWPMNWPWWWESEFVCEWPHPVPCASAPWSYKLSEVPDHTEFPNRCLNALERGDKLSWAVLSLSIDCGRSLVVQLSLDAEGRIQLLKRRRLLLFESPVVTQIRVWDGRYDLVGHIIPMISQETPDLSKVAGEHERDLSNAIPPCLIGGLAEVLGPGPRVTERQNFRGVLGEGRVFSSHFKKTPLAGLKKLQLARA